MDLEDYVNALHATEQAYEVNKYEYDGIKIWPIFRSQTIGMFRNPKDYFNSEKKQASGKAPSLKDKILNVYYSKFFYKKFITQLRSDLHEQKLHVLLYSKSSTHTDLINGKWYDRFVDPFYEKLQTKYSVLKLELSKENQTEKSNRCVETKYIKEDFFKTHFFYKNKNKSGIKISGSAVFNEIKKNSGLAYEPKKVDSALREIIYYRDLFREVFKIIKPKFVFLKCYYEHDSFGLILAAKESGITTIDIQHGKQGICHPMYTNLTKIPQNGYELLPNFFWNWGQESFDNIYKWLNRKNVHQPTIGGNLWLAKWKNEFFYEPQKKEEQSFVDSFKKYKKVILYALQPLDSGEVVPSHIKEVISKSPKEWLWLFRKHPFQKITEQEIRNFIGNTEATVEVNHSTNLPLYFLLKNINYHITLWSSTCFEANDFDIPTIISHEFGCKLYEKQIKENIFSYSISSDEIINIIRDNKKNVKSNYIKTDKVVAESAFKKIGLSIN